MTHFAKRGGLLSIAATIVFAASASGIAQIASESSLIGNWEIKGADTEGTRWVGALVLSKDDEGTIAGHIDWTGTGGQHDGAAGREYVVAMYDAMTRAFSLEGERLEKANGIVLGFYVAQLSEDGNRMLKGKWSADGDPGGWQAKRAAAAAPGKPAKNPLQTGFVRKTFTSPDGSESIYWLFVPHNYHKVKNVPVILFLHGSGETKGEGDENGPVSVGIGPHIAAHEKTFPYLVVFPQAEEKVWRKEVNATLVQGIFDKSLTEFNVDPQRIFLTGLSMGGTGVWDLAAADPERWAAIVPICGRARPDATDTIKDIPCWAFHGAADKIVPVSESRQMVAALRKAGSKPNYIEFPSIGHNCWDQAYATPELWKWLAKQKRSE